jgi:hypothetical protein
MWTLPPDCHRTSSAIQRRIDRRRLAVVLAKQMGIDAQGNVWFSVAEALADRDDVDTASISWLAWVCRRAWNVACG